MKNLTNGPGKLTKALGITMDDYGHSFSKLPSIYRFGNGFQSIFQLGPVLELIILEKQETTLGVSGSLEMHLYPDTEKQLPRNEAVVKM